MDQPRLSFEEFKTRFRDFFWWTPPISLFADVIAIVGALKTKQQSAPPIPLGQETIEPKVWGIFSLSDMVFLTGLLTAFIIVSMVYFGYRAKQVEGDYWKLILAVFASSLLTYLYFRLWLGEKWWTFVCIIVGIASVIVVLRYLLFRASESRTAATELLPRNELVASGSGQQAREGEFDLSIIDLTAIDSIIDLTAIELDTVGQVTAPTIIDPSIVDPNVIDLGAIVAPGDLTSLTSYGEKPLRKRHTSNWPAIIGVIVTILALVLTSKGNDLGVDHPDGFSSDEPYTVGPLSTLDPSVPWFQVDDQVVVVLAGLVNVRSSPGYRNKPPTDVIYQASTGEQFRVIDGPQYVDALYWWKVSNNLCGEGWIAQSRWNGEIILSHQDKRPSFVAIDLPKEYLRDTLTLSDRFFSWPQSRTQLGGVPFIFDDRASFIQTQFGGDTTPSGLDLPTQVSIPVNVENPKKVYILMNLSYGCAQEAPPGSEVGFVEFVFGREAPIVEKLQTGHNIREWVVEANIPPTVCPIVEDISAPNVQKQVWSGRRKDSGKLSVIDMFVFDVPPGRVNQKLTEVVIHDTSMSATGFANPGILIFALTVLSE